MFFKPNPEKLAKKRDVVGLLRLLGSDDRDLRREASYHLGQGDLKQSAIPYLMRALSDHSLSADAARLLGSYGATEAIDSLVSALNSSDQQTRREAAAALGKMPSPNIHYKDIQPLLDAALCSEPDIRQHAIPVPSTIAVTRAFLTVLVAISPTRQ